MIPTIIINNSAAYECSFCGLSSFGYLYIDVHGLTLADALQAFGAADTVTYKTDMAERTYSGFHLTGVEYVFGGTETVRISMMRNGGDGIG